MSEPEDDTSPTADDFARLGDDKITSARLLFRESQFQTAYSLAGEGLECHIKAVIMRRKGFNRWPDRRDNQQYYSHNILTLLRLADLEDEINDALQATPIPSWATAIAILKDWRIDSRYDPRPFPRAMIVDFLDALDRMGAIAWLKAR